MRYSIILLFSLFTIHYSLFTLASPAYAQEDWSDACTYQGVATLQGIQCLIGNVLSVALQLLGLVLFLMLLFGGIRYLSSGGDPKAVDAAKGTITGALTGLVLAILSWFILRLIQDVTGVQVTLFKWPSL